MRSAFPDLPVAPGNRGAHAIPTELFTNNTILQELVQDGLVDPSNFTSNGSLLRRLALPLQMGR
jgi:hypothetical protein